MMPNGRKDAMNGVIAEMRRTVNRLVGQYKSGQLCALYSLLDNLDILESALRDAHVAIDADSVVMRMLLENNKGYEIGGRLNNTELFGLNSAINSGLAAMRQIEPLLAAHDHDDN